MWKQLWVALLVSVLSTGHADANRERSKRATENNQNKYQNTLKAYTYFKKPDRYIYKVPNVTISTTTSTPFALPPIPLKHVAIKLNAPSRSTSNTSTTPSTTTTSTFKPTTLPPHERMYLPPPQPTIFSVTITPSPYPSVNYKTTLRTPHPKPPNGTIVPPLTLPPPLPSILDYGGPELIPLKPHIKRRNVVQPSENKAPSVTRPAYIRPPPPPPTRPPNVPSLPPLVPLKPHIKRRNAL